MAKKEYSSPIAEATEDLTRLFRRYFHKGWVSDTEIYGLERQGRTGVTFVLMRKLLRLECQRRSVPFFMLSSSKSDRNGVAYGRMRVMVRKDTVPLVAAMALMDHNKLRGLEDPRYGRMVFVRWEGAELTDAIYALVEQQQFIAKIRAIGAEHYPLG